jgi:hypothetical protein
MTNRRWVAPNDDLTAYEGRVVGDGHCVAFVRKATGLPSTAHWRRGPKVRAANLIRGTAIATFNHEGRYDNATDGTSHAAILLEDTTAGLMVLDQWVGHPVGPRTIRYQSGAQDAVNDGERYFAIETADLG